MMTTSIQRRSGGFTLLEIIIGLAILGIVLAFAVGWAVNRTSQEVERAFNDVDATLRHARGGAMEVEGPWLVIFSSTGVAAAPATAVGPDNRFQRTEVRWDDGTVMELLNEENGEFMAPLEPVRIVVSHRSFLPTVHVRVRREERWISGVIDPVSGAIAETGANN